MKAILGLDLDGVMVLNGATELYEGNDASLHLKMCPRAVKNLNSLLLATPCLDVVLTTAWRIERSLQELQQIFIVNGMEYPHRIIGVTPILLGGNRAEEIRAWLDEHGRIVAGYAIVDDMPLESEFKNFVRIDPKVGLTWNDVQKVLRILNLEGSSYVNA